MADTGTQVSPPACPNRLEEGPPAARALAAWWRPPLEAVRLLDVVAGRARQPLAIAAASPELLGPALVRFPTAPLVAPSWQPDGPASLPWSEPFTGVPPRLVAPTAVAPASLGATLWLDPDRPPGPEDLRLIATWLADGGLLAVAVRGGFHSGMPVILRLRHRLGRAGLRRETVRGYLGPRALAWSALGRAALLAGRPDAYDRCHAAMRATYAERWPLALACRLVLVMAWTQP